MMHLLFLVKSYICHLQPIEWSNFDDFISPLFLTDNWLVAVLPFARSHKKVLS